MQESSISSNVPQLKWVENLTRLLDDAFVIPGTKIRFGLDPLLGLVPVVGDILTWIISLVMVIEMSRHNIPSRLVGQMLFNILIDFLAGLVPVIGDILDVSIKCNRKNWELFRNYHIKNSIKTTPK